MSMIYEGRCFKYGDHIDTDVIIPARWLSTHDPGELGRHCLEGIDPSFVGKVSPGDMLVAGVNFGCGSSREHAPLAIKACGVSCVIAKSFARIFFRNSVNVGLAVVECPQAEAVQEGDRLWVDLAGSLIHNLTQAWRVPISPYPRFIQEILASGGLVPWANRRKEER